MNIKIINFIMWVFLNLFRFFFICNWIICNVIVLCSMGISYMGYIVESYLFNVDRMWDNIVLIKL